MLLLTVERGYSVLLSETRNKFIAVLQKQCGVFRFWCFVRQVKRDKMDDDDIYSVL